ncbi:hypothetical protein [Halostella sp. PRR32]|uniref:hypothetical protein n=1 Tax=Halostella sp. PRR32 TaxID=3098147 RepID=UPI002B1CF3A4|nr:hypothetical protein [Halostella sp. PRR32]
MQDGHRKPDSYRNLTNSLCQLPSGAVGEIVDVEDVAVAGVEQRRVVVRSCDGNGIDNIARERVEVRGEDR